MADKIFNTRVQQKHDVEANWLKATNFIPMLGEIIIYDADETYDCPRVKVGDGKTVVSLLPFTVEPITDTEIDAVFGYTIYAAEAVSL